MSFAVGQTGPVGSARQHTFLHALSFVIGFSLVFVVLGASAAFVGSALNAYLPTLMKIGGLVLIVFGLQVSGVFGWLAGRVAAAGGERNALGRAYLAFDAGLNQLIYTEGRIHMEANRSLGYLSSGLMGLFFVAGWIPCVGPVLSAIYVMAGNTETVGQGALLLAVYSAGLGIPFLLVGAAFSTMTAWLRKINRHLGVVSKITGVFLIFIGVLLFTSRMTLISIWFVSHFGLGLASVQLGSTAMVSLPLAFIAGLLSFLSPCVLPLIPAYIGYLSGTAVVDSAPASAEQAAPAAADESWHGQATQSSNGSVL